jgi:ABC transport system ATP-binding/permease protein
VALQAWLEQSGSEAVKKGWGILLPDSNTKSKSLQPSKEKPSISEPECAEKKKLSYKEQRELELLPAQIEQAESRLEQVQSDLAHPDVYTDHEKVVALNEELQSLESNLEAMYARWSELE